MLEPELELIAIDRIRAERNTQSRVGLNTETIDDYAEKMERGVDFPPITVFYDGRDYWLADGWHRLKASCKAQRLVMDPFIRVDVRKGNQREALLFSIGANAGHGLPRTRQDKRRAVTLLLNDSEWSKWSDNFLAQKANVSQAFVSKVRREMPDPVPQTSTVRRTARGGVMDTRKIGSRAAVKSIAGPDYQGPERRKSSRREADRQLVAALTS